jgi:hypothetical protein
MCELSDSIRLFFIGLTMMADDSGVLADDLEEIQKQLFPNRANRPIGEMVDVLVAAGPVRRMISPHSVRVLLITNFAKYQHPFHPAAPRYGYRWELSALPCPSAAQRNVVKKRYGVMSWSEPVDIVCEECGTEGTLRFAVPELGSKHSGWKGAVASDGVVEIVPTGNTPDAVHLICRACRADTSWTGPSGVPAEDGSDGDRAWKSRAAKAEAVYTQKSVPEEVWRVYQAWVDSTGQSDRKLTEPRRAVIVKALKSYAVDDVILATQGWRNLAYYRGENEDGVPVNEITILLKDSVSIDRFIDVAKHGLPKRRSPRRAGANVGEFGIDSSRSSVKDDLR